VSRLVVIGAGAMGLAAGYYALKRGHDVTVLEAAPEPGGMAAHFDWAVSRSSASTTSSARPINRRSTFSPSLASATACAGCRHRWVITSTEKLAARRHGDPAVSLARDDEATDNTSAVSTKSMVVAAPRRWRPLAGAAHSACSKHRGSALTFSRIETPDQVLLIITKEAVLRVPT
jgi:glycine/D-amino acid oxidase-like deaminating enzyme